MNIVLLNGSPNKNGDTAFLLNKIAETVKELGCTASVEYVQALLNDCKTPFCLDCSKPCNQSCYKGTLLAALFDKMISADAIVVGSPVYFGTVSAQIKALFDKTRALRADRALLGKACAAVAVGASKYGGQQLTVRAIHDMALVQGMTVVSDSAEEVAEGMGHSGVCAQKPARVDEYAIKRCEVLGTRLCQLLL